MSRIFKNKEQNYYIEMNGKCIMLLNNGVTFETVNIDYRIPTDDMYEIINIEDKIEILEKGGLK